MKIKVKKNKIAMAICICAGLLFHTDFTTVAAESGQPQTVEDSSNAPQTEAAQGGSVPQQGIDMNLVMLLGTSVVTAGVMSLAMSKKK